MTGPAIRITYSGGDAEKHAIDMRLLGQSLQGLDRIVSDVLIIAATRRAPKRGERAPLILKIQEPVAGSYDLSGLWQELSTILPLGIPLITTIGTDIVSSWVTGVLGYFQGREDIAGKAVDRIAEVAMAQTAAQAEVAKAQLAASDRVDERRHLEAIGLQELLRDAMHRLGPASAMYVAPVGRSVSQATFRSGDHAPAVVDVEGADRIRKVNEIDWLNLTEMELRTDGFKFHTSGLSVEHPDREGFLMAKVSDPAFEKEENAYTEAAQRKSKILVLARPGYRNGNLEQIDIVDFIRETDHP